jgi:hypothetical protein
MYSTANKPLKSPTVTADQVKEIRVFLNNKNEGIFICPVCNNRVERDLSDLFSYASEIRLNCKCKCGNTYKAFVERRKYIRKPVNFTGTYTHKKNNGTSIKDAIRILNISRSGMLFSVSNAPDFKTGDRLVIEFRLNEDVESQIREEGIVKRIQLNKVGLQFTSEERYGKLGMFLL